MGLIASAAKSGPADIASSWDAFFHDWVKPVVHFGTPVLIVFAVLLILTRVLTGVLVRKDSPGVRSAASWARWPIGVMYWFGVICLLCAAIEATVVFPLARLMRHGSHMMTVPPQPWTAAVSIGMIAAAGVVVWVLFCVVGRPFRREVYAPGLPKHERRDRALPPYARTGWAASITAGMVLAAGALIVGVIGLWWHSSSLDDRLTPVVYAPLLALLGVVIVSRARGIGMGLVLQGHDKAGGDDAGLGGSVRARLYTLASRAPAGIQITQNTDVSTLPKEALNLIPDGALAKLGALFVSLFTPATPWRADVTEQSDGSIVVSVRRNGVTVDAAVIRPSTLWLPDQSAAADPGAQDPRAADGDSAAGPSSADPDSAADLTLELRTAAAAFILLTLSRRYYHLGAGLSGATEWRSVAMQVIATDPACRLSQDDRRALLVRAVAEDDGNKAAELTLLNRSYRSSASQRPDSEFAEKLSELLERVRNEEGMWPLRLRLWFNLLAVRLNIAASFARPEHPADSRCAAAGSDAAQAGDALHDAARQAQRLAAFWRNRENRKAFPELWQEMYAPVIFSAIAVVVEWKRRFCDGPPEAGLNNSIIADLGGQLMRDLPETEGTESTDTVAGRPVKMTLLARYDRACARVGWAAIPAEPQQSCFYDKALNDLEMAFPDYRTWARSDPSLADLQDIDQIRKILAKGSKPAADVDRESKAAGAHEAGAARPTPAADSAGVHAVTARQVVDRFKRLTGDPCPADFLALPPFAAHRAVLEERGIHDAAQLGQTPARTLVSELGITGAVAARWLDLADLYERLLRVPPTSRLAADPAEQERITTALVFLLGEAKLDSVAAVHRELEGGADPFRAKLLDCARPWAVVAPGKDEISCWRREFKKAARLRPRRKSRKVGTCGSFDGAAGYGRSHLRKNSAS